VPEHPFVNFLVGLANPGVPTELWDQLRPWLRRFAMAVPKHTRLHQPQYCDHVTRGGNQCEHLGVVTCRTCQDTICLKHAYMNREAQAVCANCVGAFAAAAREEQRQEPKGRKKKKKKNKGGRRWEHEAPEPDVDDVQEALEVMGLTEQQADLTTVKERFRRLSLECHPDRFTDPKEKADAEERFKRVSWAYSTLEEWARKRAA
jgi:DnaJ-class molecular chaperone